ncbi:hypothetical protein D9613_009693 [Agrocybe pediades]|uniref:RNase H type-1 domain-containing protein n=1 Tax=Agrocybe pediades TaxID=84607 RepID=A0A8H4QWL0_9AGAR|nr:hypothetical protein D9613_009693 [Agrocybe pediades]
MVSTNLETSTWKEVNFPGSNDITGIQIKNQNTTLTILNLYVDCKNTKTIDTMRQALTANRRNIYPTEGAQVMWCGDFNMHHPLWDRDEDHRLFTGEANRRSQKLIRLVADENMTMPLPKGIPTLRHYTTGNFTRPDNVWCTAEISEYITRCDVDSGLQPPGTDHYPIVTVINMPQTRIEAPPSHNFRTADWEKYREDLQARLANMQEPRPLTSNEELQQAAADLTNALQESIQTTIKINKPCPHSKRWWNKELDDLRKVVNKLSRKSFRYRALPNHESHEQHRTASKEYGEEIKKAKLQHWQDFLEEATMRELWTANKYIREPASDGGRTHIPTLKETNQATRATTHIDTNDGKANAFANKFFPPKPNVSTSVESYKYLGIQIDRRLRWTTQMQKTIAKATSYTLLFRRLTKQSTGVSAKLMRRLYLTVIIPKMTYGLDVWYTPPHKPEGKRRQIGSVKALKEFRKIQRLATLAITGAMRTTPNELLDSHAGLLPVDLLLKKICHRAIIRLSSLPQTNPAGQLATKYHIAPAKTHVTSIQKLIQLFQIQTHRVETINPKTEARNTTRNYLTTIAPNAKQAEREEREDQARAKVYTDAANHQGQLGAAAVLYENNAREPAKSLRYKIGPDTHHTIDDAESVAGLLGCWLLKNSEHRGPQNATMYTDSQNLIKLMNSRTPSSGSYIVEAIKEISDKTAEDAPNNGQNNEAQYKVRWIPAHGTSRGNDKADKEAKKAARGESSPLRDLPPLLRTSLPHSAKALKTNYHNTLKQEAEQRWNQSERKEKFDRDVDDKYPYDEFRKQQTKLNRAKASILMQVRTGHLPLNAYLHRFGQHYTSRCNACYRTTRRHKEETLKHYLFECPEYRWERADMDKKMGRNSRNLKALLGCNKTVKVLMEYIEKTGRLRIKQGDVPNAQPRDNG